MELWIVRTSLQWSRDRLHCPKQNRKTRINKAWVHCTSERIKSERHLVVSKRAIGPPAYSSWGFYHTTGFKAVNLFSYLEIAASGVFWIIGSHPNFHHYFAVKKLIKIILKSETKYRNSWTLLNPSEHCWREYLFQVMSSLITDYWGQYVSGTVLT